MSGPPSFPRETLATEHLGSAPARSRQRYLAVFEAGSSFVLPLPDSGELCVGRGDEAGLRLHDVKVSRRHITLSLGPARALVTDLESQNGTFVNGERLFGSRALVSGDVIDLGKTAIVFHSTPAATDATEGPSFDALCAALDHETERAASSGKPLAVLSIVVTNPEQRGAALARLRAELVGLESMASDGNARLLVMMPETSRAEGKRRALDLLEALKLAGVSARTGLAVHPADGCDADTLVSSARYAAGDGAAGNVRSAHEAHRVVDLGSTSAVLADAAMLELYALVDRLAASDLPVLIHGETGSGKELCARALHQASRRKAQRLTAINCAALSESLLESELFGHEKGAFTGAAQAKVGLLEASSGGSVFFDEIAELPLTAQAKLLRALDTGTITRVGDVNERPIDVRVVAATNRHLEKEVAAGRFRQDLYFRLSGATLWLPPLRDRPRELALLAQRFLAAARERLGRPPMTLSDDSLRLLTAHRWPGNVRELKNVMEFAAAAFDEPTLEPWQLSARLSQDQASPSPASPPAAAPNPIPSGFRPLDEEIRELEKTRMREALAASDGNQRRAAQLLGVPLRTFVSKLAQHGLRERKPGAE